MNAPRGIKHCAYCDNEIDDAQTYCSEACEQVVELKDTLEIAQRHLAKIGKIANVLWWVYVNDGRTFESNPRFEGELESGIKEIIALSEGY